MKFSVLTIFIVAFSQIYNSEAGIPVMSTILDVFSFGSNVYKFFDRLFGSSTDSSGLASLRDTISNRIKLSTQTILFTIQLQSHLSELRETALTLKALLERMDGIASANTEEERNAFKERFQTAFEEDSNQVYRVKYLLTHTIPVDGISSTLLDRVSEALGCDEAKIEEFKNYYMTLVSNAVALEILYEEIKDSDIQNHVTQAWTDKTKDLFDTFNGHTTNCTEPVRSASSRKMSERFIIWSCVLGFILVK